MADDTQRMARGLQVFIGEIESRIRRYTMDHKVTPENLQRLSALHEQWRAVRREFLEKGDRASDVDLMAIEDKALVIDRQIDLIQRELISQQSFRTGTRTVLLLAAAFVALGVVYLWSHGVTGLNFGAFEPLAETGPLKYLEVGFWALFGGLCYLLFRAADYMSRRDFDEWYQMWYLSTALRSPLITIVLMVLVLEFVEWYGEDTWIQGYLLEEGNKFYFIAFMSFSLGLASDRVAGISRELSEGVADFVEAAVKRVGGKLKTAIAPDEASK